jgi:hypothetical protein
MLKYNINFIGIGEDDVQRNNSLIAVSQPNVLKFSNCIMEGVDLLEQYLLQFNMTVAGRKSFNFEKARYT